MDLSMNALLAQVDDYLFTSGTQAFRAWAGLEAERTGAELLAGFPELSNAELAHAVRERLESPRADEVRRARLGAVHAFLLGTVTARAQGPARDALRQAVQRASVVALGRTWSGQEALAALPRQPGREAREALQAALERAWEPSFGPWARLVDGQPEVARALGQTALSLPERAAGRTFEAGMELAREALALTQDAWTDLLAHALRRVEPGLRPGQVGWHDLLRAVEAPWLAEHLRKEDLEHAVTRCLTDLGLHPNAHGRIAVDAEPRPGREPGARCFPVRVPDEIRLGLIPGAGFAPWEAWLDAWMRAQHQAAVARTTPFVERALGDQAVPAAVGLWASSFLLDEAWLKRYVRLPSSVAVEVSRLFAFRQAFQFRLAAALLGTAREALVRGGVVGLRDEFTARVVQALDVPPPPTLLPVLVDPLAPQLGALDAWALSGALHEHLQERFNEDYWRNPATGRWLGTFAQNGQRDDARAVAKALGHEALTFTATARRRVAVMGA